MTAFSCFITPGHIATPAGYSTPAYNQVGIVLYDGFEVFTDGDVRRFAQLFEDAVNAYSDVDADYTEGMSQYFEWFDILDAEGISVRTFAELLEEAVNEGV